MTKLKIGFLGLVLAGVLASALWAATVTVTIPGAAVPNAAVMCEELRLELRVRGADWSNDLCATYFTRLGVRLYVGRVARRDQRQIIENAAQAAVDSFDTNWPEPFTAAFCGDSTVDTEFGEECDDGNQDAGDGCSSRCTNE